MEELCSTGIAWFQKLLVTRMCIREYLKNWLNFEVQEFTINDVNSNCLWNTSGGLRHNTLYACKTNDYITHVNTIISWWYLIVKNRSHNCMYVPIKTIISILDFSTISKIYAVFKLTENGRWSTTKNYLAMDLTNYYIIAKAFNYTKTYV